MAAADCTVQRVNKGSSELLLRKFADMESEPMRRSKRMKPVPSSSSRKTSALVEVPSSSSRKTSALVERNSLLPPSPNQRTKKFWTFKATKTGRERKLLRNQFFSALVKQRWDQTVERASKMLLEKHCNPHVQLKDEFA